MICLICSKEVIKYYLVNSAIICQECWRDYKYDVVQELLDKGYSGLAVILQQELDSLEPHNGEN